MSVDFISQQSVLLTKFGGLELAHNFLKMLLIGSRGTNLNEKSSIFMLLITTQLQLSFMTETSSCDMNATETIILLEKNTMILFCISKGTTHL